MEVHTLLRKGVLEKLLRTDSIVLGLICIMALTSVSSRELQKHRTIRQNFLAITFPQKTVSISHDNTGSSFRFPHLKKIDPSKSESKAERIFHSLMALPLLF